MAAKEETVFSFQEIVAVICGFQTKDRSKSVEVTDTSISVQEEHERAQVSACVIILFIKGCRNEEDLLLSGASMIAPLRTGSVYNSLFVVGTLRDHTKCGCVAD